MLFPYTKSNSVSTHRTHHQFPYCNTLCYTPILTYTNAKNVTTRVCQFYSRVIVQLIYLHSKVHKTGELTIRSVLVDITSVYTIGCKRRMKTNRMTFKRDQRAVNDNNSCYSKPILIELKTGTHQVISICDLLPIPLLFTHLSRVSRYQWFACRPHQQFSNFARVVTTVEWNNAAYTTRAKPLVTDFSFLFTHRTADTRVHARPTLYKKNIYIYIN